MLPKRLAAIAALLLFTLPATAQDFNPDDALPFNWPNDSYGSLFGYVEETVPFLLVFEAYTPGAVLLHIVGGSGTQHNDVGWDLLDWQGNLFASSPTSERPSLLLDVPPGIWYPRLSARAPGGGGSGPVEVLGGEWFPQSGEFFRTPADIGPVLPRAATVPEPSTLLLAALGLSLLFVYKRRSR